jgi:hypothetical protein
MKQRSNDLRHLCAQTHEDDGQNPRFDRKDVARPHSHKDLQLCKQVRRALDTQVSTTPWAGNAGLRIEDVSPDPDATRLRVKVSWSARTWGVEGVLALLAAHKAELRWAAANAITRKRAPELTFEAAPRADEEVSP